MPKSVDSYVADNSKELSNVNSRFVQVDSNRSRDLSFGYNFVNVAVGVEVYKRSTGDQVVFGHPSESKGFGRGTFGDDKGAWSLVTDAEATAAFTKAGRKAVAEALDGQTGAIDDIEIGGDTTPATTEYTSLVEPLRRVDITASRTGNTTRSSAFHDSTDIAGQPGELGVFDATGRLLARVTVDIPAGTIADTDEIRGAVTLTFTGDGNGKAVITTDGEEAIAESIRSTTASVGPSEYAFGDGTADFDKSDTSLTSEVIRKNAGRDIGRDRINAYTRVTESDMGSITVDLSEVGLFDNTGRMIWATTFRTIPSDSSGFNTDTTIVVG